MNEFELRSALAQILENYQRCGLSRIHTDAGLDTAIRQTVESWRENRSTSTTTVTQAPQARDADQPVLTRMHRATEQGATEQRAIEQTPTESSSTQQLETPSETTSTSIWNHIDLPDAERLEKFQQLDSKIKACRLCDEICRHRQQTVFGSGPIRPRVCFIGEAPGADEDRTGQPFVGQAGQLLTKIIAAMQLQREDVYILNSLKCRPPSNRTPTDHEIANCRPFMVSQLAILQPKYIVCLGAVAVRALLSDKTSIGRLRGRFFQYQGARVVITYHPAYLLRNDDAKRLVWDDMQMLMREMGIQVSRKV